ncbi:MAG: transketolase [Gammaproteobacteria bacterium]|nr:transketolase [Gammaproteobacteria bacterium]
MLSRRQLANALRILSIDAVERAKSGHPGMPMGMADIAEVLWNDFLKHNPADPGWWNRDRFILSNGHGSMLHYALLHLTGYNLTIEDLKQFRQLHSKTAGHPELFEAPGIETTTGPLGQGLANGVGMAIAEKRLAAEFNRPELAIIDHHTYVFIGDGCLMEGISHEACSLAGKLGLGKLIVIWDDNDISIDGKASDWMEHDPAARFTSYGWQAIGDIDGHDADAVQAALKQAHGDLERPTLLCCRTEIGHGSPNKVNTAAAHGAPLGNEEIALTRAALDWQLPPFEMSQTFYDAWDAKARGAEQQQQWQQQYDAYQQAHPQLAQELQRRISGQLPQSFDRTIAELLKSATAATKAVATRKANSTVLAEVGKILPEIFGGSADLSGSNCTLWPQAEIFNHDNPRGNYLHYGVREFAMTAIMNGIALHGGFIPYGGTFLAFLSYNASAVRMSALMKQRVIHVFTHDSIGLGEDGPTHQPIEQLSLLRNTPNLVTWRPCDGAEAVVAWQSALQSSNEPTVLCMSRQNLAPQPRSDAQIAAISRGGYILRDCEGVPEVILLATGSEVDLAMRAVQASSRRIRVVSLPATTLFDRQSAAYREQVLPAAVTRRIAIEAASTPFWYKYVGLAGQVIGMDRFGLSAPAEKLFGYFGLTVEALLTAIEASMADEPASVVAE